MKTKRMLTLFTVVILIYVTTQPVMAQNMSNQAQHGQIYEEAEIHVVYNGTTLSFEPPAVVKDGYVFFPIENLLLGIGVVHGWDQSSFTVTGTVGNRKLEIPLNSLSYIADGKKLDVPDGLLPFVLNERTYVYLDYIAQVFELDVSWNGETNTIIITNKVPQTTSAPVTSEIVKPSINLVDKRFELIAVISRLAGYWEFDVAYTDYQKEAAVNFNKYKDHPAVVYLSQLNISASDIFAYAMHIKEDMSGLVGNIRSIISPLGDRWTEETANAFWPLMLDFYKDTDFEMFYKSHIKFYQDESEPFAQCEALSDIDYNWFEPFCEFFGVPARFKFIISPSLYYAAHGAEVEKKTNYAVLPSELDDDYLIEGLVIHEFCHSFGNGAGIMWFMENDTVRSYSEENVGTFYTDELDIAIEYMVRAYTILYFADQGMNEAVTELIKTDKSIGFKHVEDVYKLVRKYEKRD